MKTCTKCGKQWQDDFNICPLCGGPLTVDQPAEAFVSMGNANAISGGIHHSDDHSVSTADSHNTSTADSHNTTTSNSNNTTTTTNTTTNSTVQNIYNGTVTRVEREKTQEELLKERKLKYRECCKKVLADGLFTNEERIWLEEQRVLLDLSAEMASHILSEVQNTHQKTVMSMGTVQRIQFNNLKRAVEGNMVQNVKRLLPQIKVIAGKFQEEELQFLYHMVLAALNPQECVNAYTARIEDKYWLSFWTYVSLHKLGDVPNAENVMIDLGRWQGLMPDENLVVLGALGSLIDGDADTAKDLYMQAVTGEYSPLLTNLTDLIVAILHYDDKDADILAIMTKNRFYIDGFLRTQYEKVVERSRLAAEQERLRREEEERKRKEEEERKRREAEERRRREEEERKRREEELRKQREEEERKRREDEERKRREAEERRRREEEERKRREEEMRKQREEEERKRREEEERKRREEELRKQREEEERKRREEEMRKQREEEERKRKEEEERKRREEELRKQREEEERRRREAEERKRIEAEEKARKEAEEKARREEEKARYEAEHPAKTITIRLNFGKFKKKLEETANYVADATVKAVDGVGDLGKAVADTVGETFESPKSKKTEAKEPEKKTRVCPKCGSQMKADAKFCNKCGADLNATITPSENPTIPQQTAENQQPEGKSRFCPKCGNQVKADAKFCNKCGTKLNRFL